MTACKKIPGLEEPSFYVCTIIGTNLMSCTHVSDETAPEYDTTIADSIGWLCVSPKGYGDSLNHHKALHLKIEEITGKKHAPKTR